MGDGIRLTLSKEEKGYPLEDQLYILARNKLVPIAENITNAEFGKNCSVRVSEKMRLQWCRNWTITFLAKMDELAREHGLIN
jgi:hypothetical protein